MLIDRLRPRGPRSRPKRAKEIVLAALLAFMAATVSPTARAQTPGPVAAGRGEGAATRTTLDVLTYNVEGVPGRRGRGALLAEIGRRLHALNQSGRAPDVVLFQEVFSKGAKTAVRQSGYPALTRGPSRKARRDLPRWGDRTGRKWRKGEIGIRIVGSGLAIASAYPITVEQSQPFSRRACAGFDCLSNKGGLHVRIKVPGVPDQIDIVNTHMNAQGASGVRPSRHLPVHHAQALELSDFIAHARQPGNPLIVGGDFNMRGSERRFAFFETAQPLQLVHQFCLAPVNACDVRISLDGDAPWMDTQDLQMFTSGRRVTLRPLRVEAMFDGSDQSPKLSDHDGLRVLYELSWSAP